MEAENQQTCNTKTSELDNLGQVVDALQESIGQVSSNLILAYQKMAQNMESNIKMMANMNKMMEAMVLQQFDLIPIIQQIENQEATISIEVRNRSCFPLKSLQIKLFSNEQQNVDLFEKLSERFDIEAETSHYVTFQNVPISLKYFNIQLTLPSPGTGEMISTTSYHTVIFSL